MELAKALQMTRPFEDLPHYETAVAQLYVASAKGKRELHRAAYRIRDAFAAYHYATTYGKQD
ncbi:hypothetical protein JHN55_22935 [Streptomyces sp. MBT56]|uniref:hypothetical protein n=1 Tax=unclassified Streptomyces TaxID=2593676 RepID=UPI00190BC491|nr:MULTISPECIES: hypothetical protein [unclassified Streptomyces]MBK3559326.1 hypothetical protein [Streptomyces sp. MBT56]MBK3601049.1 hypothetical protein [Streptomyces sp. MBT54]MBK3613955.1 hypothetical protein [Streptomyces sp. MBT98]MBK6041980.1 hypothetical protein [Streptomyces sp. MBT55]